MRVDYLGDLLDLLENEKYAEITSLQINNNDFFLHAKISEVV